MRESTAAACAAAGGLLWAAQWPLFLLAHGPTEYNENETVLGVTGMEADQVLAVPLALAAVALVGVEQLQARRDGRFGRVGFGVALAGFAAWIVAALAGAPPHPAIALLGVGMTLFGVGTLRARVLPVFARPLPLVLGVFLVGAVAADVAAGRPPPGENVLLVLPGGLFTHVAQGVGWIALAYALLRADSRSRSRATA